MSIRPKKLDNVGVIQAIQKRKDSAFALEGLGLFRIFRFQFLPHHYQLLSSGVSPQKISTSFRAGDFGLTAGSRVPGFPIFLGWSLTS